MRLPDASVRGRIRRYLERHADLLGDNVLEVGTRLPSMDAWWANNRGLARGQWLGLDAMAGPNVDVVGDVYALPREWDRQFSGVVCSEVLEHLARPWRALPELQRVLQPSGWIVITTLFAFPEHHYPDDYYRYSRSGLTILLQDAGFEQIAVDYDGDVRVRLNDHGEPVDSVLSMPIHTFAVAQCCK